MRLAAAFAQAGDDGLALRQRHGQELCLPGGVAHLGAEGHVFVVAGALGVAMGKGHGLCRQSWPRTGSASRVRPQARANAGADQEIAVAGHPVHGHAGIGQGPQGVDDAR